MLASAVSVEVAGNIPWPSDVTLYQPDEERQMLLSDRASCLSVQTFLEMAEVKYSIESRTNAEFMSPSGHVPFIRVGPLILAEFNNIMTFLKIKGVWLSSDLTDEEVSDMKAYISLVEYTLTNAELFLSWCDKTTRDSVSDVVYAADTVTKVRYGAVYVWPLNQILATREQWRVQGAMDTVGWRDRSRQDVLDEVASCCESLSVKLGDQPYFMGTSVTELDALVYGHLSSLLNSRHLVPDLAEIVTSFPNLTEFCRKVTDTYPNLQRMTSTQ